MSEAATRPALQALLADLGSGDSQRAEAAALALPDHGAAALAALISQSMDSKIEARWWALRALAGFGQEAARQQLAAALADPDPGVQQCAALGLVRQPHAAAAPTLVALLRSPDGLLARLAGDALVALGAEPNGGAGVDPLIATLALDDAPLNAKVEAARALALIGDTRAVPALFKLLGGDSSLLEHWASEGLEKMGVGMAFFKP